MNDEDGISLDIRARPVVLEAIQTLLLFSNDRSAGGEGGAAAGLTVASKPVQHSASPSLKDSQVDELPFAVAKGSQ